MDKIPQIAEEKLVMMMDKAQETKLQRYKVSVSVFSADISKSEEIPRWRPIDKTLHYDFSATEMFFKNRHNIAYQKDSCSFQQWVQQEAKRSILQDYEVTNRHTDTHTELHVYSRAILFYCFNIFPSHVIIIVRNQNLAI